MLKIKSFVFSPIQENTYLLYNEFNNCAIIDPGMDTATEQNAVVNFIRDNGLKPVLLLNTHCHIDHVLGNRFVFDQYGLKPQFHEGELPVLVARTRVGRARGQQCDPGLAAGAGRAPA